MFFAKSEFFKLIYKRKQNTIMQENYKMLEGFFHNTKKVETIFKSEYKNEKDIKIDRDIKREELMLDSFWSE